jgi:hypothetical protein
MRSLREAGRSLGDVLSDHPSWASWHSRVTDRPTVEVGCGGLQAAPARCDAQPTLLVLTLAEVEDSFVYDLPD